MSRSILQGWVVELGLRHQGVLLTAVRGCDTVPKEDVSKRLTRHLRSAILNCHCGDPKKAVSFVQIMNEDQFTATCKELAKDLDHYPLHYIMHLVHTSEILGYYHPDMHERALWCWFYELMVHKFHLQPETKEQLDNRLNVDESTFGFLQDMPWASDGGDMMRCKRHSLTWDSKYYDGCPPCIRDGMTNRTLGQQDYT